MTMEHYAGIDVSLELSSLCIVDATGRIIREAKVASEPEALIGWLPRLGPTLVRIGLEAGPLSQWLYAALREAGLGPLQKVPSSRGWIRSGRNRLSSTTRMTARTWIGRPAPI
jgi:hypothetical protein